MSHLTRLDLLALTHLCRNLRAGDREELFATMWTDNPDDLAIQHMRLGEFGWLAWHDGRPVAAVGAAPRWPGVWSVWGFGTDEFNKAGLTLAKHIKRVIIPTLYQRGAHRADAYSLATHDEAHKWMISLGAYAETRIAGYGKGGEDFILFAWDRKAVERLGATGPRQPGSDIQDKGA